MANPYFTVAPKEQGCSLDPKDTISMILAGLIDNLSLILSDETGSDHSSALYLMRINAEIAHDLLDTIRYKN